MNIFSNFSKILLAIFGAVLFIGSVAQLQAIALDLMNSADTFQFYLGILYLAIVIFIWGAVIYFIVDRFKNKNKKEDSKVEQDEQVTNNN